MKPTPSTILVLLVLACASCRSSRHASIHGHLAGGVDATRTETADLPLGAGGRLELVTPYGQVEVRTAVDQAPSLVATVRGTGRTQQEAEEVLARYELEIEQDGEVVRVALRGEPARIRDDGARLSIAASVDYVATVPAGTTLRVDSSSGDIRAVGAFASCRLRTRYGSVVLEGAEGDVSAESDSGDVTVRSVAGGRVSVESGYGNLSLEGITGTAVRAASKSGDVVVVNVRAGKVDLDTNYGSVSVRGAEAELHAASRSGDIQIDGMKGAVDARSQYGRVAVEGVLTAVEARSSSGPVRVRALEGSTNATNWELSSGYGEVALHVPPGFGCELAAHTRYGVVDCAFPITVDPGKRRSGALRGTVGQGGRTVTLASGSGNLALKQL